MTAAQGHRETGRIGPAVHVRAGVRTPDINAELRSYSWPESCEIVASRSTPAINLALDGPPPTTKLAYRQSHGWGRYARMGSLLFIPPDEQIQVLSPQGEQLSLQCEINASKWRELSDLPAGKLDRRQLDATLNVRDGFIVEGMARLAGEVACPGFGSIILIESLGISMLGQLVRYLRRSGEAPAASHGITPAQLRRIDEFIEESDGILISVASLARICGLSRSHFMRMFKLTTGKTVYGYVKEHQIARAKSLLMSTSHPLKVIAHQLGFSGPTSFSLAFRNATGETPTAYREAHGVYEEPGITHAPGH